MGEEAQLIENSEKFINIYIIETGFKQIDDFLAEEEPASQPSLQGPKNKPLKPWALSILHSNIDRRSIITKTST